MSKQKKQSRYKALIEKIFLDHYSNGVTQVPFQRVDLETAASELGIVLPKNLGDIIYSIRYRTPMPDAVLATQPEGMEWIIEGAGASCYLFKLVGVNRILPNPNLVTTKIPDATPEIIAANALTDEQALLAKIRYNRLIDLFLGLVTYSLQNHLRTNVSGIGQIEIDEIYVGIDRHGSQYVLPIQAKGGCDQLSVIQTKQDVSCCKHKFPTLICRPISTQFMADDLIAIFELTIEKDEVRIVDERHYRLVPSDQISPSELTEYRNRVPTS
ncbi:MAG: hypothetical protein P4L43_18720 [Syntrophobacteraceae bacterium]|nr:hypothetical protein [Syntrophobacteraceae bacterium]